MRIRTFCNCSLLLGLLACSRASMQPPDERSIPEDSAADDPAAVDGDCTVGHNCVNPNSGGENDDEPPELAVRGRFAEIQAGLDYPTDSPAPDFVSGKKVLVLGATRILVPESARLASPEAGVDYPTDTPIPSELEGKQVLVLGETTRLVVRLTRAATGGDDPTDAPPSDAVVWGITPDVRVDITELAGIEMAVAGIDFPTDVPAKRYAVLVMRSGDRIPLD